MFLHAEAAGVVARLLVYLQACFQHEQTVSISAAGEAHMVVGVDPVTEPFLACVTDGGQ